MGKTIKFEKWIIAILLLIISILTGIICTMITPPPSPQSNSIGMDMDMTLKTFGVPQNKPIPTVSFTLQKEPNTQEWDVHILTTHFTFTPNKVGEKPVLGEGHVHLFIDSKLYVVLGPWFHIDTLPKGKHTILLRLANNDHSTYAVSGSYIQTSETLNVQ